MDGEVRVKKRGVTMRKKKRDEKSTGDEGEGVRRSRLDENVLYLYLLPCSGLLL
jgi:hypothetical protein